MPLARCTKNKHKAHCCALDDEILSFYWATIFRLSLDLLLEQKNFEKKEPSFFFNFFNRISSRFDCDVIWNGFFFLVCLLKSHFMGHKSIITENEIVRELCANCRLWMNRWTGKYYPIKYSPSIVKLIKFKLLHGDIQIVDFDSRYCFSKWTRKNINKPLKTNSRYDRYKTEKKCNCYEAWRKCDRFENMLHKCTHRTLA